MDDKIETAGERAEGAAEPRRYEVHTAPDAPAGTQPVPARVAKAAKHKSPAQWAYERIVLYLQAFEEKLDPGQEVAMAFAGNDSGVLRIEGMGYFDPDMMTFYGTDALGAKMQIIQHVSQLDVMLRALPLPQEREQQPAQRIGFRLARDMEDDEDSGGATG